MIAQAFEYHRPRSVGEAVQLARRHGDDARFLAGGHSLLPMMKLRLATPSVLIDLAGIAGLDRIAGEEGSVRLGAMASHRAVAESGVVRRRCGLLALAAGEIGDPQVRNRGTIGGSVAHADPAADYPAALLALDAEILVEGEAGERTIPAEDFFSGLFRTALQEGELVTAVRVPALEAEAAGAYRKLRQPASGFAIAGAAALVVRDESGRCRRAAVALTGVGPAAFRARAAEQALQGKALTRRSIAAACRGIASGAEVQGDLHASAEYRRAMAEVFARRALAAAAGLEPPGR